MRLARALVEADTRILRLSHCDGNRGIHQGMSMKKETLKLKATSTTIDEVNLKVPTEPNQVCHVIAGRCKKSGAFSNKALISRLQSAINSKSSLFIQMRHGVGYLGCPTSLEAGWLSLANTTIHGTKKVMQVPEVLIQVRDGSFIAHIHATDGLVTPYVSGEK